MNIKQTQPDGNAKKCPLAWLDFHWAEVVSVEDHCATGAHWAEGLNQLWRRKVPKEQIQIKGYEQINFDMNHKCTLYILYNWIIEGSLEV